MKILMSSIFSMASSDPVKLAEVVVVEVETTLRSGDVTHSLGKLARFTEHEPVRRGKKIFGAVAYLRTDASVQAYAERQGLFVIRATGRDGAGASGRRGVAHRDCRPCANVSSE